ncbi:MAG TPA: tRNA (adenosine(37)-N6)-threonylcarbamoyltransferase complex dimerization subunit type 1 TsaB [Thauera sp.]|nr:tRNA (adenosine(37)-N6)-threonylcarbamoyltransferase complex dimerization subunit type 1 TsaB [Thauera sp.]HHW65992.1 tRNA (adenosine(37)-N6)-threonylcarbamoyltransferase complex dimerization subunit type 1 TsaB [Rhodocyclaceae bacterium]
MNILSIETASEHGSVALLHDGELLVRRIQGAANHSEAVLRDLRELLSEGGIGVTQLDAIAFGAGPGAFTGLRLACGVAQGLALGADLAIAAINSLQAIALQADAERVFVATDARMGEVYHAAFEQDHEGVPIPVGQPGCSAPLDLELPPGDWFAAGSAFRVWPEELEVRFLARLVGCRPEQVARAEEVARLGAVAVARGMLTTPELAGPLYVRDKVAFTTAERLARGGRA